MSEKQTFAAESINNEYIMCLFALRAVYLSRTNDYNRDETQTTTLQPPWSHHGSQHVIIMNHNIGNLHTTST